MRCIAYGEIIWDVYPDARVIGGGPFNFSGHIAMLGDEAHLLSAVGRDELGREALAQVRRIGVCDALIQENDQPTGVCRVTLDSAGKPTFTLESLNAFDEIQPTNAPLAADAFYFGTVAQRNPVSRATLRKTISEGRFSEIICDINLRKNCFDLDSVSYDLHTATILKLSDEEAIHLYDMGFLPRDERDIGPALCALYPNVKIVLYTLGAEGSLAYDARTGTTYRSEKPNPRRVVSTVGAGDSYCASFLHHYLAGASISECVARATEWSAFVVEHQEAIPDIGDNRPN